MDNDVLSRNNHAFFYVTLAMVLMGEDFEGIVNALARRSEDDMVELKDHFETITFSLPNGEVGYLQIGKASADLLSKVKSSWWNKIPRCISGEYNEGCCVPNQDGNDITLKIIGYETPQGFVSDYDELKKVGNNTPLGIVVAVYVVPHMGAVPSEELVCVWDDENRINYA